MSRRCATAARTFRFSSVISPTSTRGVWENKSRVFPTKRWMRSLVIAGRVIYVNCRTLWSEPPSYQPVHRCECRWLKFLQSQAPARLAGAMSSSKPRERRLCARYAKAIGLSEALLGRQLALASRERRSLTRVGGWGSLARRSDGRPANAPNLCLLISLPEDRCPTILALTSTTP